MFASLALTVLCAVGVLVKGQATFAPEIHCYEFERRHDCDADPICLDVVLDCADGSSCVSFSDPPTCSAPAPGSCG